MIKENKEKSCLFFASDYHFEMISLPYINRNLKNNKKVIVLTENDLNNSVNKVLTNINMDEDEKNKLKCIDWNNDNVNKLHEIKTSKENENQMIVFVKGKEDYINQINKNINDCVNNKNIEIINCYDINEVSENVKDIVEKYDQVLSMSGIEKLM